MTLLIINADDFGYSSGINYGIIDAHQQGVLTSTTMMANMPGFDHGVLLAKKNPNLGVGVHLTLTCGRPLLDNVHSLVDETGMFHKIGYYEKPFTINEEDLYREWKAQINKLIKNGIYPTHLDSHHHVNTIPGISETFITLAKEFGLPVRNNFDVEEGVKTTTQFINYFDKLATEKEIWKPLSLRILKNDFKTQDSIEIMCHPGYIDEELLNRSSFTNNRPYVGLELRDKKYPEMFKQYNVKLGTFNDLRKK